MKLAFILFLSLFSYGLYAQDFVPGEVIIKLKGHSNSVNVSTFKAKALNQKQMHLKGSWKSLNMYHYKLQPGKKVEDIVSELKYDPAVEYVEPNYIIRKADIDRGSPLSEQDFRSLANIETLSTNQNGSFVQTAANIKADQAWDQLSDTTDRPIVAIIDTGVDRYHSAFTRWCALWVNEAEKNGTPGIDDDANGYVDDIYGYDFVNNDGDPLDDDGHGTHVAGIVLGTTQDLLAVPEIMPTGGVCHDDYKSRIQIMPVKFLDGNGSGTTSDAIKSIYYAVNNGAKVLNNSWGGGSYSQALHEAIVYAYNLHTVFVAAAGNEGKNNNDYAMFPANYDAPNVISVASTQSTDYLSYFSNYGSNTVHLASPGSSIYSTFMGNTYAYMSGTSMAAPFVSGVAALIAREQPTMNGYEIKNVLLSSSSSVATDVSGKTITGTRLNVLDSVLESQGTLISGSQPSYSIGSSTLSRTFASSADEGGGCGMVTTLRAPPGSGGGKGFAFALFAILFSPIIWLLSRRNASNRRKHERFEVHSKMKLKIGDEEICGALETISLGGLGLDVNEMLEKGSVVTVKLQSPDGDHEVEVKGKIVWSDGAHHGLAFTEENRGVLNYIRYMISTLAKGRA